MNNQLHIGPYQVISTLGKGGMGIVYKAVDTRIQHTVAIKVLHSNISEVAVQRFIQEGQLMARLRHPNILKLYEINQHNNNVYLAMEFFEGQTLTQYIQENPYDTNKICNVFAQVANAIQFIHSAEIIHRDLKPDNIMIGKENNIKIMDFGLARFLNDDKQFSQSGMIMGTLQYMPPEQADGNIKLIDKRSDVYALGAILYQMITMQKVFEAPNMVQLVCKIHEENPIAPTTINKNIPDDLQKICLRALEKKQENRYQSAGALADDIIKVQNGETIELKINFKRLFFHFVMEHKMKIAVIFILFSLVSGIILYNYVKNREKNYKAVYQLYQEAANILSGIPEKKIAWNNDIKAIDIDATMSAYIEADYYLDQAYKLDSHYDFVNDKIMEIYSNICILSTLTKNYPVAEFYLQTCQEINPAQGKVLAEKIVEHKNMEKRQHQREIQNILDALQKEPQEGEIDEYVFRASKMKSHHTVELLLSYINSPIEWQRIFTIQVIGILGDLTTTYQEKNSGDWLSEHLSNLQIPQQIYEVKIAIWALGKLRYSKSLELVKKIRSQFAETSLLYKQTEQPYLWLSE